MSPPVSMTPGVTLPTDKGVHEDGSLPWSSADVFVEEVRRNDVAITSAMRLRFSFKRKDTGLLLIRDPVGWLLAFTWLCVC